MTFAQFIAPLAPIINGILAVLGSVAVLVFMAGMTRYVFGIAGDVKRAKDAKDLILWGLLSLFVLFCIGGILNFFANDFFGKTVYTGGSVPSYPAPDASNPTPQCTYDSGTGQYTCNGFSE